MPTPVTAARACLTPEASAALDAAVSTARRRSHAQTTSLHFISSLLSSPLLRDALSRSRSTAYSPRLQFKALELCFSVALDRLPSCSSSSSSTGTPLDEPPISNSLMAAIKRSQANQRRNPDTFHLYQQQSQSCASSSSFSGVKVELQQLILAILDDPVVSRVFGEAGFRSSDIKIAVLRPAPPPILRFPRRCPPLFLCSFSNGSDELIGSIASSGDEHCRKIGEILSRDSSNGRNPMLVGAGAGDAARDFAGAVNRCNWSLFPPELEGIRIFDVELDEADRIEDVVNRFNDIPGPGVVLNVGDLNELLEGEMVARVVSEVSRVLELKRGRVWVMGWSVNYETYLKFLSKYPLVDKDWELRILPITPSSRANGATAGCFNKTHSFVPFGGFFGESFEPVGVVNNPYQYQPGTRCQICNYNYEQEAMTILKASSMEAVDQVHSNLPSWMPKSNSGAVSNGFGDATKVSDENKLVLNGKIANLQKKWTDYCHRLHTSYSPRIAAPENNYPLIPGFVPVTQNPAIIAPLPKPNRPIQSISLPSSTNPRDEDLISKLQPRHSKSDQLHLRACEDHASPSSATSVTTDLALATPRGPPPEKTESPKVKSHSQVNRNATPVTTSQNLSIIPDVNSYKSFFADLFKRVGRQEEALKHISDVISSRAMSQRGIWLGFQGGDQGAQKRVATALAEMIYGRTDNLISVNLSKSDLSKCFNARNHGKTSIDYIASEIAKMPSAVVYIENVDEADFVEQKCLDYAVNNGKLRNSYNREIGISRTIFLLSSRRKGISVPSSTKKYSNFAEENILSAQGRKMKIVMESPNAAIGSASGERVVITRRCESAKRKSDTCYGSPKRPHLGLDLNLPIEESKDEPENNSMSEDDSDTWAEELFEKLDRKVKFSAFNYNALADEVLWNVNRVFCEKFGPVCCQLEIEIDAMEQILAVEERRTICEWVEMVLGASFGELKQRCNRVPGSAVFRLVSCEKDFLSKGEHLLGSALLPCKIIIN